METKKKGQTVKILNTIRNRVAVYIMLLLAFLAIVVQAQAQTDMTGVVSAVEGYVDAGIAVGIGVLLFVLGRRVLRKLV